MNLISLEDKRKQKAMEEMVKLPVYESIRLNDEGELVGKLVDYVDIPRHCIEE